MQSTVEQFTYNEQVSGSSPLVCPLFNRVLLADDAEARISTW
jgi:hypothetical protein